MNARRTRQGPRLVLRDEEVGSEAVVLDQKRNVVLEPSDEADDGASVADAVAGMEDQTVRHGGPSRGVEPCMIGEGARDGRAAGRRALPADHPQD